jgi:hypothetical protein
MSQDSDSYELLVKNLHEALLKHDGVETINVQHNVKLIGKSGASHQIDVYWEFKLAGVTYKTCIECKYYKRSVEKSHIAAFSGILEDLGNATGIFATCSDYQSGAKLFAQAKGIRLVRINYLIKEVNIQGKFITPNLLITDVLFDKEHVKDILKNMGIDNYNYVLKINVEDYLLDKNGKPKDQIKNILEPIMKASPVGKGSASIQDSYYLTEIGPVKLLSIDYEITHSETNHEMLIPVNDISNAILNDVLQNTSCYLNDDGSITEINSE